MTRFSSSLNAAAITQPIVPYVMFAEFDFVSGTIRVSSADKIYTWGGNSWTPLGELAGVDGPQEATDLSSQQLTFTLTGVDNGLITTTLGENYHNRSCSLSIGYLDPVSGQLVDTPELLWEGRMDTMTINTDANSSQIVLVAENRLVTWQQSSGWLYTQEHQRIFDSTDNFFDQVTSLSNKSVKWNDTPVYPGIGTATRNPYPSYSYYGY